MTMALTGVQEGTSKSVLSSFIAFHTAKDF
jgi:hypothetical protein